MRRQENRPASLRDSTHSLTLSTAERDRRDAWAVCEKERKEVQDNSVGAHVVRDSEVSVSARYYLEASPKSTKDALEGHLKD